MDLTTVSAVLSSLKTATEIAKFIKDTDASLEKAESKLKLADLISALAETRIEVANIQQILLEKDTEILALKTQLEIKTKLHWEKPYYWLINDSQKDGPFCQHCYDKNRELIRLQGSGSGYWVCKACKNNYKDNTYAASPIVFKNSSRFGGF